MTVASPAAIDQFLDAYTTKVDAGFGLIQGDVQVVFATLITLSIGASAVLWAIDDVQNVPAALIRKILQFGFFAWLITSWHALSLTIVNGFAALGLKAAGGGLSVHDVLNSPSKVVNDGVTDAAALAAYIGRLANEGFGTGFFKHFDVILCASVAAIGLILAFLVLGVEIAVTIIEFHLVTLIALVTVPFGILTQTSFLSERAIGYVASIGLKLMAIAVIVSIGESLFAQYTVSATPGIDEDCGLLLSGLLLLVLAFKLPAIAGALISGGPQLSSSAAITGAANMIAAVGGLAMVTRMGASALAGASTSKVAGALAAAGGSPLGGSTVASRAPGAQNARGAAAGTRTPSWTAADDPPEPLRTGADSAQVVARARARRDRPNDDAELDGGAPPTTAQSIQLESEAP